MTKTREQMAKEYADHWEQDPEYRLSYDGFLAGYKAAQDSACIDTNSIDTGTQMQWISVKERLPEVFKVYNYYRDSNCVLITVAKESDQQTPINPYATVAHLAQFQSEEPMWTACRCSVSGNEVEPNEWKLDQVTHWMPLPKPPEAE